MIFSTGIQTFRMGSLVQPYLCVKGSDGARCVCRDLDGI